MTLDVPGLDKRALLERAAAAAHAFDTRVVKVEASLAEEIREILVVTSDGTMARDTQPLVRFGVRVIAEKDGKRQEGSSGGGGRTSLGYFEGKSPEWHAREAARQAITMLDAQEAPGGADGGRPRARRQRHPAARGRGARARGGLQPQGDEQLLRARSASRSRASCAPSSTTRRSSRAAASINVDDEGNEPRSSRAHREGQARRLHARPPERQALQAARRAATGGARASRARRCRG